MNLHVALVTKRYPHAVGGDATAVAGLESELRLTGDSVTIITSRSPTIPRRPHVHRLGVPRSDAALDRPGPVRALSCIWTLLWGLWFLARHRPDVVHAHAPELGAALALPARALGIPRVLTLHGSSIGKPAFGLKSRLEKLLVQLGGYDRLFTVDPRCLAALHGLARTPPVFVPNGVVIENGPAWQGPRAGAPILFVGRLEDVKGVDVLLAAVARARAEGCQATLDVVGSGRLEPALRRLAAALSIDDASSFVGSCSHAEVLDRMARAAALVLPSNYEGFPIVLLEAWAVGLPVIVTSVGAVPQVCTDGQDSLVVRPQDPEALAHAVVRVLGDTSLAQRLGASGRRTVQRYNQKELAAEVREHYRQLVSPRVRRLPPRHRKDMGRLRNSISTTRRTTTAARNVVSGPSWGRSWVAACVLCLLAAIAPLVYLSSHQAAISAGRSAALYFPQPSHVASWSGKHTVRFAFVIRNLSLERRHYRLVVALSPDGRTERPQGFKVVRLAPRERRLFRWTVTSPTRRRFEVSVTVPGTANSIHFWARAPS